MEFLKEEYIPLYFTFAAFSIFYGLYGVAFARYHQYEKREFNFEDGNSILYTLTTPLIPVYGLLFRIGDYAAVIYVTIFVSWQVGVTLFIIGFLAASLLGGLLIGILHGILSNRTTILLNAIPMLYFFYRTIVIIRALD